MKGGVIVKDFEFKHQINCHMFDCVSSTLFELGLATREVSAYISNCYKHGIPYEEIVTILDTAYGIPHLYKDYYFRDAETFFKNVDDLKSRLVDGEGLIGMSWWHQFIIFKEHDTILIRDSQANLVLPLYEYLMHQKIDSIRVIYTEKGERVERRTEKITKSLFDTLYYKFRLPNCVLPPSTNSPWLRAGTRRKKYRKTIRLKDVKF